MGSWNTSISGNDTAKDLQIEYAAAFCQFDVEEALKRIDCYIRSELFDETDEEEWCNYQYSLAEFMWKKGILTERVRNQTLKMIDSGFGLEVWAETGLKTLESRKEKLEEFKEKLLSPQPPRKRIKPNVHMQRVFEAGDVVAVQLQTAAKPYTGQDSRPLDEKQFQALDGKYVLMQLVDCYASWESRIAPDVKDYWARFRLYDGIYDTVPDDVDPTVLKDAAIHQGSGISPVFTCESSMVYFKRRNCKVLCNRKELLHDLNTNASHAIFWAVNTPWSNPDSQIVAAMGKRIVCGAFSGNAELVGQICQRANRYGRFDYQLSPEENETRYEEEERVIAKSIHTVLANGGKLYSISFGREMGIVTVENGHIDHLYIEGAYQRNGFGTCLLEYAFSMAGKYACIDVPKTNKWLLHICDKLKLKRTEETEHFWRMRKE